MIDLKNPVFIVLRTEWFEKFASGAKKTEYRRIGGKFTRERCVVGRSVLLSKGYGKKARLTGRITSYAEIAQSRAPRAAQEYYPDATRLAAIGIRLDASPHARPKRPGTKQAKSVKRAKSRTKDRNPGKKRTR
ncbi:MAG: hypothetical protein FWD68_14315 [Alphaproteobacteria bacterium]|nr:hypothetical protein [Alphaproteobacteria bacterium]